MLLYVSNSSWSGLVGPPLSKNFSFNPALIDESGEKLVEYGILKIVRRVDL